MKKQGEDDLDSLNEKVKLEFSLQNAIQGLTYSIKANQFNEQLSSYNSEQKQPHTNNCITFENFYVCDYYFENNKKFKL